jgi:hypothetical protein
MTLLMFTAELPLLDRVKVNQAVPVPTGVLPKFWLDGLRVTVWAMSVNGASNEMTTRVSMLLQTKLMGILLCFICRDSVSEEARRTPASATRPLFWVIEGIVEPRRGPVGRLGGERYSYIALMRRPSKYCPKVLSIAI